MIHHSHLQKKRFYLFMFLKLIALWGPPSGHRVLSKRLRRSRLGPTLHLVAENYTQM